MTATQAGVTALVTAYARVYHAVHDLPIIFDDSLADQFYSAEEHASFDQHLANTLQLIDPEMAAAQPEQSAALARVMQLHYCPVTLSRSAYTEQCLEEAIGQGVQQVVILGAGFDTFAFRRKELSEKLDVFEVDHPVTQAMKRERIEMAGWESPARLHFVPLDFNHGRLPEALFLSGYNPDRLSFFSWQGVTYYLSREVVLETLQTIGGLAPKGSQIVFDYMDSDAFRPETAGKRIQLMQAIAKMVGEPIITGFDPQGLAVDLAGIDLRLCESLSPMQIEARFFSGRTDDHHAFEHVHFAKAAV